MAKRLVTHKEIRELLTYCPRDGTVRWEVSRKGGRGIKAGDMAGYLSDSRNGYVITINQIHHRLSHVIWFWMTGEWPTEEIDHRNGYSTDNRWENLRLATHSQNMANKKTRVDNSLKVKGVGFYPKCTNRPFRADLSVNGKKVLRKHFATLEEAAAAYKQAAIEHFGEFARW